MARGLGGWVAGGAGDGVGGWLLGGVWLLLGGRGGRERWRWGFLVALGPRF